MNPKDFYNSTAKIYDLRHSSIYTRHLRRIEKKIVKKFSKGLVLDVGGGTGFHSSYTNAINLDISIEMLRMSKARNVLGDVSHMPFPNESFDTVLCMFSVLSMVEINSALKEMNRVLKKDGIFITSYASIWDKEFPPLWKRLDPRGEETKTIKIMGSKIKLRLFSKDFMRFVENFGFRHMDTRSVFVLKRPIWNCFDKFSPLLLFDFLGKILKFSGAMYISVFRKL